MFRSLVAAAAAIAHALNAKLPVLAHTTGDSIAPKSVSFTGIIEGLYVEVKSAPAGSIHLGSIISGPGVPAGTEIVSQLNGTPGGAGLYNLWARSGYVAAETMTESYGVLTVGSVSSGAVAPGELLYGSGIASDTAILSNLSGSGPGSTWIVNKAQTVVDASASVLAPSLQVLLKSVKGATADRDYLQVSELGSFDYDYLPSTISYVGGTAAAALGLTKASGAVLSNPGGQTTDAAQFMDNLIQNETDQFGSFQVSQVPALVAQYDPTYLSDFATWARSTYGQYIDLAQYTGTTPPAGSSKPTTDPPGSYSLAGASAATLAQPGYYVPTAGASSETKDSPGYYTPLAGATAEILAQAPTISGTVAGQTAAPGDPVTPFSSAIIADPNIDTTDSLSIKLTGAKGTLADGPGFDGLTSSAPGVYLLSGTAGAITSELEALLFTPGAELRNDDLRSDRHVHRRDERKQLQYDRDHSVRFGHVRAHCEPRRFQVHLIGLQGDRQANSRTAAPPRRNRPRLTGASRPTRKLRAGMQRRRRRRWALRVASHEIRLIPSPGRQPPDCDPGGRSDRESKLAASRCGFPIGPSATVGNDTARAGQPDFASWLCRIRKSSPTIRS